MIAPNVVATAGHCVNFGTSGGTGFFQKSSFRIYPGRNGSSSPYLCPGGTVARAEQLWTNATWNSSGAETNDYGAITLSCDLGNTTGYFGWTSSGHTVGSEVDTQGYPGDKPSGTQWDADNCSTAVHGHRAVHASRRPPRSSCSTGTTPRWSEWFAALQGDVDRLHVCHRHPRLWPARVVSTLDEQPRDACQQHGLQLLQPDAQRRSGLT